jgi:carboxylesterase type B
LLKGFLNINSSPSAKPQVANFGIVDQIAALHWIKENIGAFGGDPGNVTLMGYEAGAASIHFLMSSPAVVPGKIQFILTVTGLNFCLLVL